MRLPRVRFTLRRMMDVVLVVAVILAGYRSREDLHRYVLNQGITTLQAAAAYKNAQLTREVAEIAIAEQVASPPINEERLDDLRIELQKARAEELAKRLTYERELATRERLEWVRILLLKLPQP
jgi:uncharacterized lipoprotein YehR (DUF1307 family)